MESTTWTLHSLIDCFGCRVNAVQVVTGVSGVLDIVPCLELFETLGAGVVDVLGIGDELRRGRRSVGSGHFMWRMG